jgi:hypothetical protein
MSSDDCCRQRWRLCFRAPCGFGLLGSDWFNRNHYKSLLLIFHFRILCTKKETKQFHGKSGARQAGWHSSPLAGKFPVTFVSLCWCVCHVECPFRVMCGWRTSNLKSCHVLSLCNNLKITERRCKLHAGGTRTVQRCNIYLPNWRLEFKSLSIAYS